MPPFPRSNRLCKLATCIALVGVPKRLATMRLHRTKGALIRQRRCAFKTHVRAAPCPRRGTQSTLKQRRCASRIRTQAVPPAGLLDNKCTLRRRHSTSITQAQAASSYVGSEGARDWPMEHEMVVEELEDGTTRERTLGSAVRQYIAWCNEQHAVQGLIRVQQGEGGLPMVLLQHPSGCQAQVYLYGANVASWTRPNGKELLHCPRELNNWDGQTPILGGTAVIFPQVRHGPYITDGFLNRCHWNLVDSWQSPEHALDAAPGVMLYLAANQNTRKYWPYDFEAFYSVELMEDDDFPDLEDIRKDDDDDDEGEVDGWEAPPPPSDECNQLMCTLQIRNTDDKPFTFTTALKPHFATLDQQRSMGRGFVRTLGLGGKFMYDWTVDPAGVQPLLTTESYDYLTFGDGRIDRMYIDANEMQGDILFCPGDRTHFHLIHRSGFKDLLAWNAGDDSSLEYASLGMARVARPVTLYPGEVWTGEMVLRHYPRYWDTPIWGEEMQPLGGLGAPKGA